MSNEELKPVVTRTWHELYVLKEADPFDHRSDKEFCEEIGLDVGSFRNWKNKFRAYIYKEVESIRKNYINEYRSKGHKALAKKLDKDTNAIKLLFQLLGDLVEKTESKVEMNQDDQVRRVKSLMSSIGKRQVAWESVTSGSEKDVQAPNAESLTEARQEAPLPAEQKGPAGPTAS